jgi:alanine racemase
VATAAEGIAVRAHSSGNIYVLHGVSNTETAKACREYNLIPILNNLQQVSSWNNFAKTHDLKSKAILHVDVGMGRLGFTETEARTLSQKPELASHIDFQYIMGHMSCAEQPHNPSNQEQLTLFNQYRKLFPMLRATFANSSGIFLGHEYHFDLVRPGCALYGLNPNVTKTNPMAHVVELHGYILQKRTLEREQYIGYGQHHSAKAGTKLFAIEAGYADGYGRSLSNKGQCYVQGHYLPIVGVVSMDIVMVDATALPDDIYNNITHVELIGQHITVDDIAKHANTISYEIIITRFGQRCRKIYVNS